jgi:hypothetical protein
MNTIEINPISLGLPTGIATKLMVRAIILSTRDISCYTYYEVSTQEGKVLASGECPINEEQYANWGSDNTYIEDIVISYLGLERAAIVPVEETPVEETPVNETPVE